jgi:hypothetical protein
VKNLRCRLFGHDLTVRMPMRIVVCRRCHVVL